MENTCTHENGGSFIGDKPGLKENWKKYSIDKQTARKHGASSWSLYVCTDCGRVIDEDNGKVITAEDLGSYIDDLMLVHDVRIIEFVEAL